ncbi:hypothetical protein C5167_030594 [Papaver somniferum]|nr:hypothetical protein C5167_030594 [Papaver somniferum]
MFRMKSYLKVLQNMWVCIHHQENDAVESFKESKFVFVIARTETCLEDIGGLHAATNGLFPEGGENVVDTGAPTSVKLTLKRLL